MTYEERRLVLHLFHRAEDDTSGFWDGADSVVHIAEALVLGTATVERMLGDLYRQGIVEEFRFRTWRLTDDCLRTLYSAQAKRAERGVFAWPDAAPVAS